MAISTYVIETLFSDCDFILAFALSVKQKYMQTFQSVWWSFPDCHP